MAMTDFMASEIDGQEEFRQLILSNLKIAANLLPNKREHSASEILVHKLEKGRKHRSLLYFASDQLSGKRCQIDQITLKRA